MPLPPPGAAAAERSWDMETEPDRPLTLLPTLAEDEATAAEVAAAASALTLSTGRPPALAGDDVTGSIPGGVSMTNTPGNADGGRAAPAALSAADTGDVFLGLMTADDDDDAAAASVGTVGASS